jgi:signal transduction histidine kinase
MNILRFVQKLKVWRLWLLAVALAVLITEVVVSAMGLLLLGEITADYLLTGLVASFLAASLVSALIVHFVGELKRLSESLQRQVTLEVARSREKDHLLIQQSRLAAMGEMMGSIAHQWRQPLNALGLVLANIKDAYDHGELNRDYLNQTVDNGRRLIRDMSGTIDEFRNFHR